MKVTAAEIRDLMNHNKMTIRTLALTMGVSQVRVRQVRDLGLNSVTCYGKDVQAFAMDWYAGITGSTLGFSSWTVGV